MSTEITFTEARARLASLCDRVSADRDVVIIKRRGAKDIALISTDELSSITETAHLLRSPRNAARLRRTLKRARDWNRKPIRTGKDHRKALKEIERLWSAKEGTPEDDRLEVLVTLVNAYEEKRFPIDMPDPIDAIRFRPCEWNRAGRRRSGRCSECTQRSSTAFDLAGRSSFAYFGFHRGHHLIAGGKGTMHPAVTNVLQR